MGVRDEKEKVISSDAQFLAEVAAFERLRKAWKPNTGGNSSASLEAKSWMLTLTKPSSLCGFIKNLVMCLCTCDR